MVTYCPSHTSLPIKGATYRLQGLLLYIKRVTAAISTKITGYDIEISNTVNTLHILKVTAMALPPFPLRNGVKA